MSDKRYKITKKVTIVGMFVNIFLAISKTILGIIGSSSALFADGIHSFSDLFSDCMILFAAKYSNKGEDNNHPYGHERLETLATLVLSILLISIGFIIIYKSLISLIYDNYVNPDHFTIFASIFSIICNEFIYQYTMRAANIINSDMLRAKAWHSRSDMWSSLFVLIGILGAFLGFAWMDSIASLLICYMIVKMGFRWSYSCISELIDEGVDESTRKNIQAIIMSIDGVEEFHYLRTRKMAGQIVLDVHILVDKFSTASEGHYISEIVKSNIYYKIPNIKYITVHVDVINHNDNVIKLNNFQPSRKKILAFISELFVKNNIDITIILTKRISIYYFDDQIIIDMYVKNIHIINNYSDKLKNLSYNNYCININLYYQISDNYMV